MKGFRVSALLVFCAACELPNDPPPPKLRIAPDFADSIVITGRVAGAGTALHAVHVRVVGANVSAGTNEAGRYQIVVPARFRGQIVPVQALRIGFNPQVRSLALTGNQGNVDFELAPHDVPLTCVIGWR